MNVGLIAKNVVLLYILFGAEVRHNFYTKIYGTVLILHHLQNVSSALFFGIYNVNTSM